MFPTAPLFSSPEAGKEAAQVLTGAVSFCSFLGLVLNLGPSPDTATS